MKLAKLQNALSKSKKPMGFESKSALSVECTKRQLQVIGSIQMHTEMQAHFFERYACIK